MPAIARNKVDDGKKFKEHAKDNNGIPILYVVVV
jgi:hypothetical protein